MANREIIYEGGTYSVNEFNVITDLGKFENVSVEVLYWYNAMMNGFSDRSEDDDADIFDIEDNDRTEIKRLFGVDLDADYVYAKLIEDSNGFCYLSYE